MAVSEHPNRGATYVPYIWLVYLAALFVQPAFDPSAGVLDWLAVAVLIVIFLPLYRSAVRTDEQQRLMILIAAFALLAVIGSLVNTGRQHLRGLRRSTRRSPATGPPGGLGDRRPRRCYLPDLPDLPG